MQKPDSFRNRKKNINFLQRFTEREKLTRIYRNVFIFIFWILNVKTKLINPSENTELEEEKDQLIGKKYCFFKIKSNKIVSPITGKVIKVFFDKRTILISDICGMQIILRIEAKAKENGLEIKRIINEGQSIKRGEIVFLLKGIDCIECITIYIPWQPLIIKRINGLEITYRNPWSLLKTKTHGFYL